MENVAQSPIHVLLEQFIPTQELTPLIIAGLAVTNHIQEMLSAVRKERSGVVRKSLLANQWLVENVVQSPIHVLLEWFIHTQELMPPTIDGLVVTNHIKDLPSAVIKEKSGVIRKKVSVNR